MDSQIKKPVEDYISAITSWLSNSQIGKTIAKRKQIAQVLFWPFLDHNITVEIIDAIQVSLNTVPFQFAMGNMFEQLVAYMQDNGLPQFTRSFWENVAKITPTGLNTSPNACCGKYELLYRLVRPNAVQPNKGDILDEGVVIELKGVEARICDPNLSGLTYITQTNTIFEMCNEFDGNATTTERWKGQKVFEIEKFQHKAHYSVQFAKNPVKARDLIGNYLIQNGFMDGPEAFNAAILIIGDKGEFAQDVLQRITLTTFFNKYKEKQGFDKIIIFGDGTNVKFIETVEDLDQIKIEKDFFRIGQKNDVGWYVR
jgi:hypothetical protein